MKLVVLPRAEVGCSLARRSWLFSRAPAENVPYEDRDFHPPITSAARSSSTASTCECKQLATCSMQHEFRIAKGETRTVGTCTWNPVETTLAAVQLDSDKIAQITLSVCYFRYFIGTGKKQKLQSDRIIKKAEIEIGGIIKKAEIKIGQNNKKSGFPLKSGDLTCLQYTNNEWSWIVASSHSIQTMNGHE